MIHVAIYLLCGLVAVCLLYVFARPTFRSERAFPLYLLGALILGYVSLALVVILRTYVWRLDMRGAYKKRRGA